LRRYGWLNIIGLLSKTAYRCIIKFPRMLYDYGLAAVPEQKLSIQIDTQAQQFSFQSDSFILNRFGVFAQISTTPLDVIFSQKCHAILERPRNKGRDFFDVVYLLSRRVKPNYDYLAQKLDIHTASQLKERILTHWSTINVNEQMADVEGFLFAAKDIRKIALFGEMFKQAEL